MLLGDCIGCAVVVVAAIFAEMTEGDDRRSESKESTFIYEPKIPESSLFLEPPTAYGNAGYKY